MTGFEKVARWDDLHDDRPVQVETRGQKIILVRDGARVRAFEALCPHAGAPLEGGAVCNGRIVCPWHKASFSISDGALREPPALDGLRAYPVRQEGGEIWVDGTTDAGAPDTDGGTKAGDDGGRDAHAAPVTDTRVVAIAGAGAAGVCAVAALREGGFGGEIVLLGAEPQLAYDRTALSKFVLAGDMPVDELPLLREPEFYARHSVRVVTAAVTRLNAGTRTLQYSEAGELKSLTYDMALVATGGRPNTLELPGAGLAGILTLRSAADAGAILSLAGPGKRIAIVGNGFIGLEAASAFRALGAQVCIVAPHEVPFARQFGEQLGGMFRHLHEAHQVEFVHGNVVRFEPVPGETPRGRPAQVAAVIVDSGRRIPVDLVLVATGVQPATDFIEGLALREDGGIAVDANMQAADGLYAAGDVAAFTLPGVSQPVRIEHWRVAQQHARTAASAMLGVDAPYAGVPFFWTYHYGKRIEYLGHAQDWDRIVIDGTPQAQDFIALYVKGETVVAVLACQRERVTARLIAMMGAPLSLTAARSAMDTAP